MTDSSNGKTALAGYVQAFERVNGRTPSDEENREALALVEVVRKSNLDPFLVYYLANKRAQDALERVPEETRAVIAKAQIVPRDLAPQMARLEALLRHQSTQIDPVAAVMRYFLAFVAGAAVCELIFAAVGNGRLVPPVFDRLGMFCLGLCAAAVVLLYIWLAPIIRGSRR